MSFGNLLEVERTKFFHFGFKAQILVIFENDELTMYHNTEKRVDGNKSLYIYLVFLSKCINK